MSGSAQQYVDYLVQEGYRPWIDAYGDVIFKDEGGTYYVDVDESDIQYFCLVYPEFWQIKDASELARALVAANYATRRTKVAKVYIVEGDQNTSACIEALLGEPQQFAAVFHRAMSALKAGVRNFVDQMRQES
jgi:hypothetical protein